MRLFVQTTNGSDYEINNITQLSFSTSTDAACDSLWIYFKDTDVMDEIKSVKLYDDETLIFNGYCDCQRTIEDSNGFRIYLYARSGSCVLVDNQAEPNTYFSPSAMQLWCRYAKPFGITCRLPEIYSKESYKISGGTSCFGAIRQFVYFCTGNGIIVTPENELCLLTLSEDIKNLDAYSVLSARATINRSEPISTINYKDSLSEGGYYHHMHSAFAEENQINRSIYVNLNSLAQWQKNYTLLQKMKRSFDTYRLLELEVSGYVSEGLLQRFSYSSKAGDFTDYALVEKRYIFDEKGSRTKLTLRKMIDVKENTYVD